MNLEPGLLIGGKYRLIRPLGAGGMGTVWVARHEKLDIDVAVKLMSSALAGTASAGARFEREAKAAAQLKSPHVVNIHDYGVDDGAPYIVMELMEGEDLDALLSRERRLTLSRASEILGQTAKALRAAHDAGIVHRDLKPSNIFLARAGGELLVKILDFGIAKETGVVPSVQDRTTTGVLLGSPLYMSPEQARGGTVGPSSDLWSLAVVAFEMITGTHPFLGNTVGDVIAKICGDDLPVPSRIEPTLPPEIDAFFERALRRNPARRFATSRELADAFAAVAAVHPDVPPPLSALPPGTSGSSPPPSPEEAAARAAGREAETAQMVIAPPPASQHRATAYAATAVSLAMRPTEPGPPPVMTAAAIPVATPPPSPLRRAAMIAAVLLAGATGVYIVTARQPATMGEPPRPPVPVTMGETPKPPPVATPSATATQVDPSAMLVATATASPPAGASALPVAPTATPRPPAPGISAERPRVPPRPSSSASAPPVPTVRPAPPAPTLDPVFGLPVQK